jgi:hypothetical protein
MKRKFKQWSSIAANKANKKRSQQTIDLNINGTTYGIVNPGSVLGQIKGGNQTEREWRASEITIIFIT